MGKIAFIVGHGKSKSGGYDPGATNGNFHEFKIAKEIARYATEYYNENYTEIAYPMNYNGDMYLTERIKAANSAGYDFVAEIHLNAGGGTGTECYYHVGGGDGKKYAEAITKAISEAFGVKNRGAKVKTNSAGKDYFAIIRETSCTAVLVESLFVDSADLNFLKDAAGQKKCGEAIAKAVAEVRKAAKKVAAPTEPGKLYRVQVGAFGKRENAEAMLKKVKAAGFSDAFIKED